MAECGIVGCHRQEIVGYDRLCDPHYQLRNGGGLEGVGVAEVARRRKQHAERIAGCPLELWLNRRRQIYKTAAINSGKTYSSCACDCHDQAA